MFALPYRHMLTIAVPNRGAASRALEVGIKLRSRVAPVAEPRLYYGSFFFGGGGADARPMRDEPDQGDPWTSRKCQCLARIV